MELLQSLQEASCSSPSFITIGAFDGVHRGHQHLVSSMVQAAHAADRAAVAVTFDPHPGAMLGRSPVATLSSVEERASMLRALGLDLLVVQSFSAAVAGTSAADFVRLLVANLCMAELWVGPDFALGHRREGNVAYLERLGDGERFKIRVIEPLEWKGEVVSSTRIRAALTAGDLAEASGCLGRFYRLSGIVVRGQGLGRELGFPTANLEISSGRLIPANGVYACLAQLENDPWPSVVNVGVRPTVGATRLTVEAHLMGFERDLYGSKIGLDFVTRLRDEQTFANLDELVEQIHRDVAQAAEVLDRQGLA